ncbi:MAG: hypothetical protein C4551_02300 [Bacillota bacterium]|nr:MAG: hypothetical protein C4551_02300 [Bacillota bacterium]
MVRVAVGVLTDLEVEEGRVAPLVRRAGVAGGDAEPLAYLRVHVEVRRAEEPSFVVPAVPAEDAVGAREGFEERNRRIYLLVQPPRLLRRFLRPGLRRRVEHVAVHEDEARGVGEHPFAVGEDARGDGAEAPMHVGEDDEAGAGVEDVGGGEILHARIWA